MKNIKAIFLKQWMSQLRQPVMLIQAGVFLIMVLVFTFLLNDPDCYECIPAVPAVVCPDCEGRAHDLPTPSMAGMFAIMFVGMAMISSASSLVAEDKSTQNFRFMAMADVKPWEYLLGTASSKWFLSIPVLVLWALLDGNFDVNFFWFMALTIPGALVSIFVGLVVGTSKVAVLAMPLSFLFGMGPMLSAQNDTLAGVLRFTYTQQINLTIADMDAANFSEAFIIIAANFALMVVLYFLIHRKGKLLP